MPNHRTIPVTIIGAGLAGLGAAVHLARAGHRVRVLEAGDTAGGCCSTHEQSGFRFNNGALYMAVPSALRAAFARLDMNADMPELVPIAKPHCTHLDDGTTVHLSDADNAFLEGEHACKRTRQLQRERGPLRKQWGPSYRPLVQDVLPHEPSLPRTLGRVWKSLPRMGGSVDKLIGKYFDAPAVQPAVASTLLYTGIAPSRLPAPQIIGLMALLEEGFHLPRGGMGAITDRLHEAARSASVDIHFGARVRRVLVDHGRTRGLELDGGERIDADGIIATCSGFALAQHLLPRDAVPASMRRRVRRSPLSHRAIAIQIGCHGLGDDGAFVTNHVPRMAEQGRMHVLGTGIPSWLSWTRPTSVLPELAPAGHAIIECFAPATASSASAWTETMTRQVTDRYIEGLRRKLPGLEIDTLRVMDPPYFAAQRHLYEGALYGIAPGAAPGQFFPHRTAIKGLYLAGQTTWPGYGVPSALLSGIQAADAVLGDR